MSGKIPAQGSPPSIRSRADRRNDVPGATELTPDTQASGLDTLKVLERVIEGLRAMLKCPAVEGTNLVDLSDEQVTAYAEDVLADMLAHAFPGADAPKGKTLIFQKARVGVYDVRVHGAVVIHPFTDLPCLRPSAASALQRITLQVEFIAEMRLSSSGLARGSFSVAVVHYDTIAALEARKAAIQGEVEPVASLALLLGLHSSERWNEAVSTALLGSWTETLLGDIGNSRSAMDRLEEEARIIHQQLTPLWRREASGSRLLLLDAPMGKGGTLHDVVAGGVSPEDALPCDRPDDARLGALLRALKPEERAVVLALTCPGVASWGEAADLAGAADPVAMGKRVRRKVNRLKSLHKARAEAAARQRVSRAAHAAGSPESGGRGE
ncbi:hypothetical protein [Streptomyces sp. NPDC059258]|uniref:hypothetical protein n=1 Tax=unclassified Streptomyces TaxID=2593676 RepID=UPI0036D0BFB2